MLLFCKILTAKDIICVLNIPNLKWISIILLIVYQIVHRYNTDKKTDCLFCNTLHFVSMLDISVRYFFTYHVGLEKAKFNTAPNSLHNLQMPPRLLQNKVVVCSPKMLPYTLD